MTQVFYQAPRVYGFFGIILAVPSFALFVFDVVMLIQTGQTFQAWSSKTGVTYTSAPGIIFPAVPLLVGFWFAMAAFVARFEIDDWEIREYGYFGISRRISWPNVTRFERVRGYGIWGSRTTTSYRVRSADTIITFIDFCPGGISLSKEIEERISSSANQLTDRDHKVQQSDVEDGLMYME